MFIDGAIAVQIPNQEYPGEDPSKTNLKTKCARTTKKNKASLTSWGAVNPAAKRLFQQL